MRRRSATRSRDDLATLTRALLAAVNRALEPLEPLFAILDEADGAALHPPRKGE
jgi:hypothetical protein